MRRFSPEYLAHTREGLWTDRSALDALDLDSRERVLEVGCGTGEFTRVLAAETDATIVGLDADADLLAVARRQADVPVVAGDANRLPIPDDSFDLVVCQALLVNLPDPARAVGEFARVSSDLVAAVEPDNADVGVSSTVQREESLERRVRRAYLAGVGTDVALGDRVSEIFAGAGLSAVSTRRHHHEKRTEPPYEESDLADATWKASGSGLATHETELRRVLTAEEYDALRADWREMGRAVVEQMRAEEYRRVEVVPFDVTVGRVASESGSR